MNKLLEEICFKYPRLCLFMEHSDIFNTLDKKTLLNFKINNSDADKIMKRVSYIQRMHYELFYLINKVEKFQLGCGIFPYHISAFVRIKNNDEHKSMMEFLDYCGFGFSEPNNFKFESDLVIYFVKTKTQNYYVSKITGSFLGNNYKIIPISYKDFYDNVILKFIEEMKKMGEDIEYL